MALILLNLRLSHCCMTWDASRHERVNVMGKRQMQVSGTRRPTKMGQTAGEVGLSGLFV